jgi:hypothetical protein
MYSKAISAQVPCNEREVSHTLVNKHFDIYFNLFYS